MGVAQGEGPGPHAPAASGGDHRVLELLQDRRPVALLVGEVDPEGARIPHQRRGKVCFDEVAAQFRDALQQGLRVGVVRAEERRVLSILLDPGRHLLKDELLRARHAHVAGGVRSRFKHELDPQVPARLLHDGAAPAQRFVAHVTREGDVDEGVHAQLLRRVGDQVAAADEVALGHQVRGHGRDAGVLVSLADQEDDVRPLLANAAEALRRAGDALIDHDHLHLGVVRQADDLSDRRFLLRHEAVGIGDVGDHPALCGVAVLLDHQLGAAQVVLALGHRPRHDPDVEIGLRRQGGKGEQSANQQSQQHRLQLH